jgi:cardiolipin synthase
MSFQGFTHYMFHTAHFPVYHNTITEYYPSGEEFFEPFLEDLRSAEEFIFLEYFIIGESYMWDRVLEILKEKAAAGVEVRVMYDGLCSLVLLPYRYPQELAKYGIRAKMFAPIIPFFSTTQNNRDHRKIVVIDGRIAYTGGVNLAVEYINRMKRYGYWKDVAIRLEGRAVESFTLMFLQMWNVYGKGNPE